MPDLNEFISTEEAAEKLKYHIEHVRRMMQEGSIKDVKIGRTWLVRRIALDGYMNRTASMAKHDPRRTSDRTPHSGRSFFGLLVVHMGVLKYGHSEHNQGGRDESGQDRRQWRKAWS
jgi:excisionase family DNA binding protein